MNVCIEPRLINLVNHTPSDATQFSLPSLPDFLKSNGRPSPLEPDAGFRNVKHAGLSSQQLAYERDIPSIVPVNIDPSEVLKKILSTERALGESSPHSIRKILDDPNAIHSSGSKKRDRIEGNKEDFVQLPQPPISKKLKSVKQSVPPIIIGLHDVPPQQTLFPPIASSSFHDAHGRNSLNTAPVLERKQHIPARPQIRHPVEKSETVKEVVQPLKPVAKASRRKWTEDESNEVLRGVQKYGIGKWASILKDPDFKFTARSAVDIKDRFRVICPVELGGKSKKSRATAVQEAASKKPKTKLRVKQNPIFDNILLSMSEDDASCEEGLHEMAYSEVTPIKKTRKGAQRKEMSDLVGMGISTLQPSLRRKPRPFSEEEDQWILQGFEAYGNNWTKIQKDQRFGLQSRKRTDLRDRLRNKWPAKYASIAQDGIATKKPGSKDLPGPLLAEPKPTVSQETVRLPHSFATGPYFNLPAISFAPMEHVPQSHHMVYSAPMPIVSTVPSAVMPKEYGQFMSFSELLNEDLPVPEWTEDERAGGVGDMNIARFLSDECFR